MNEAARDALLLLAALLTLLAVACSFVRALRRDGGRHYRLGSGSEFDAFTARYGSWFFGAGVALAVADHALGNPVFPGAVRDLGAALFLACCALLVWTDRCLAHHFDHYRAEAPHLMTTGPYARLRHPRYACWIGLLGSLALGLGSGLGLLATLAFVPLVVRRVHLEERFLLERYGDRYAAYAQHSSRLLPGLW